MIMFARCLQGYAAKQKLAELLQAEDSAGKPTGDSERRPRIISCTFAHQLRFERISNAK
jgi:hypothetical protein